MRAIRGPAVPGWALRTLVVTGAVLGLAGVIWLVVGLLLRVPLVTVTLALALLLAALTAPVAAALRRIGLPAALSALCAVLSLLVVLGGVGFLIGFRAADRLAGLTRPLAAGVDRIRVWLIEGPLGLDEQQVADTRNQVVNWLYQASPDPVDGARMVLLLFSALVLVAFLVFFLLKDGDRMWAWFLERVPQRRRAQVDRAGRAAWTTLSRYARGVVLVALIDAVGIGLALLVLGVPLWVSLTLLVFLGAFIPIIGATVSGAAAVLVTLVTNGLTDAVIVLVVVLVVQQVEGNLLQPLIMGRAVHLHPIVVLLAVTAGALLFGIIGAVVGVPLVAVAYCVMEQLRAGPPPGAVDRPETRSAAAADVPPAGEPADDGGPGGPAAAAVPAGAGATAVPAEVPAAGGNR